MPRFLLLALLALLALLVGVALPAAADPPQSADDTSGADSKAKTSAKAGARKSVVLPEIAIPGDVHEPQVTFITTRPRMNADGEAEFEHHAVPALLANSLLPRGDG